ncbi:MAG: alpha-galactosidase [Clostridia bacterium]|nr:alpha-galactosidase [Clostridia bacterium]
MLTLKPNFTACSTVTLDTATETYPAFDAVYERHFLENTADTDSPVVEIVDFEGMLPFDPPSSVGQREITAGCPLKVVRMQGMVPGPRYSDDDARSALEYAMTNDFFSTNDGSKPVRRYASVGGRSSDGTMPIFDVNGSDGGYILFLGWTGSWKAEFTLAEGGVHAKLQLANNRFSLPPHERLQTLSLLLMRYSGSQKDARNRFRRLIKEHFSTVGQPGRPAQAMSSYELWGGLHTDEMCRRLDILKEHGVTFDYTWLDAAWYGSFTAECPSPYHSAWSAHTGNWEINKTFHPDDLQNVLRHIEDAGMRFELWVEPERNVHGTPVTLAHPDWFTRLGGDCLIDYGNPEAWQYTYDLLCHLIDTLHLGCYRQDFNTEPDRFWRCDRTPEQAALAELRHINGLYRLWDALLEKYPDLLIDNCASGGRRFDLESVKRAVPFFRSDYQCNFYPDPDVTQCHNNLSEYLPYNGCTTKVKSDTYAARSTYSSAWGGAFWNCSFQTMDEDDLAWAAKITAEYKRLQPYFSCDYYSLASLGWDKSSWVVWRYDRPEENDGVVMAFRRAESGIASMTMDFGKVQPGVYTFTDIDSGERWTVNGDELAGGFTLTIPEKRMSRVLTYTVERV